MPKRKTADKEYRDLTQDIDIKNLQDNVKKVFLNFEDPRRSPIYPTWYLVLILLCGYLSGCNTVADIAHYAELRGQWLNSLLGLQFNRPSYDTIWWFLVRVKPSAFQILMSQWLSALPINLKDQVLAVDGKRLRGVSNNEHITHLVNLFAVDSRIIVAQERVPDKGVNGRLYRNYWNQWMSQVQLSQWMLTTPINRIFKKLQKRVLILL